MGEWESGYFQQLMEMCVTYNDHEKGIIKIWRNIKRAEEFCDDSHT
jgi:hypothetical protein